MRTPATPCTKCGQNGVRRVMSPSPGGGFQHRGECPPPAALAKPTPPGKVSVTSVTSGGAPSSAALNAQADAAKAFEGVVCNASECKKPVANPCGEKLHHGTAAPHCARDKGHGSTRIDHPQALLCATINHSATCEECSVRHATELQAEADAARAARSAPARPAGKRVNRKGKPAVTSEVACDICGCTSAKPCDMGAGRECCSTRPEGAPGPDRCLACAELVDAARERMQEAQFQDGTALAHELFESTDMPCLGETFAAAGPRLGRVVALVMAEERAPDPAAGATPKKRSPRLTCDMVCGLAPETGPTCSACAGATSGPQRPDAIDVPAQMSLPHSEQARTLTLPFAAAPALPPSPRGDCGDCGEALSPDNSSRIASGKVVHIGCPRKAPAPSELSALAHACPSPEQGGCGAAVDEPCAFLLAEPASWVHSARFDLIESASVRAAARTMGIEDRIRAMVDRCAAALPEAPLPGRLAIERELVIPGECDVFTLRDRMDAMIERGELLVKTAELAGQGRTEYLRRKGPAVTPGRVGCAESAPVIDACAPAPTVHEAPPSSGPLGVIESESVELSDEDDDRPTPLDIAVAASDELALYLEQLRSALREVAAAPEVAALRAELALEQEARGRAERATRSALADLERERAAVAKSEADLAAVQAMANDAVARATTGALALTTAEQALAGAHARREKLRAAVGLAVLSLGGQSTAGMNEEQVCAALEEQVAEVAAWRARGKSFAAAAEQVTTSNDVLRAAISGAIGELGGDTAGLKTDDDLAAAFLALLANTLAATGRGRLQIAEQRAEHFRSLVDNAAARLGAQLPENATDTQAHLALANAVDRVLAAAPAPAPAPRRVPTPDIAPAVVDGCPFF